jgi:hypothetical protein
MRRVASYPVTTQWERGVVAPEGPAGFFDAREPIARASMFLVTFDQSKGKNKEAWQRLAKSRENFSQNDPLFKQLSDKMSGIEQHVPSSTIEYWRAELAKN